ncbi:MAG TPA: hypothetical protein VG603_08495 [Chitinophagales bacterium]|nr:hypothetical protein [Chitinophagales bacterium]
MQQHINTTNKLISRARKLVARNEELLKLNQGLEEQVRKLKQQLEDEGLKNNELNNKIKIIKLAQNINAGQPAEGQQKAELKRKINEFIREIDNCIMMLNEQ